MGAFARCFLPLLGLAALTAQAAPIPVTLERQGDQWSSCAGASLMRFTARESMERTSMPWPPARHSSNLGCGYSWPQRADRT